MKLCVETLKKNSNYSVKLQLIFVKSTKYKGKKTTHKYPVFFCVQVRKKKNREENENYFDFSQLITLTSNFYFYFFIFYFC
jgi:hypothetical protein